MSLLIINLDKVIGSADTFRDEFKKQVPDLPIRFWPEVNDVKDVEYLAFMHPDFDALPAFPNLKAMFSRSAGVESFVRHPKLPHVTAQVQVRPPGVHAEAGVQRQRVRVQARERHLPWLAFPQPGQDRAAGIAEKTVHPLRDDQGRINESHGESEDQDEHQHLDGGFHRAGK